MNIEILEFIKSCIRHHKILWTYHVNMRLRKRFIPREVIIDSVDSYEIIESYPDDKYLPSYLIYAGHQQEIIHIQIAIDRKNNSITIVTAYKPTSDKWEKGSKIRRKS